MNHATSTPTRHSILMLHQDDLTSAAACTSPTLSYIQHYSGMIVSPNARSGRTNYMSSRSPLALRMKAGRSPRTSVCVPFKLSCPPVAFIDLHKKLDESSSFYTDISDISSEYSDNDVLASTRKYRVRRHRLQKQFQKIKVKTDEMKKKDEEFKLKFRELTRKRMMLSLDISEEEMEKAEIKLEKETGNISTVNEKHIVLLELRPKEKADDTSINFREQTELRLHKLNNDANSETGEHKMSLELAEARGTGTETGEQKLSPEQHILREKTDGIGTEAELSPEHISVEETSDPRTEAGEQKLSPDLRLSDENRGTVTEARGQKLSPEHILCEETGGTGTEAKLSPEHMLREETENTGTKAKLSPEQILKEETHGTGMEAKLSPEPRLKDKAGGTGTEDAKQKLSSEHILREETEGTDIEDEKQKLPTGHILRQETEGTGIAPKEHKLPTELGLGDESGSTGAEAGEQKLPSDSRLGKETAEGTMSLAMTSAEVKLTTDIISSKLRILKIRTTPKSDVYQRMFHQNQSANSNESPVVRRLARRCVSCRSTNSDNKFTTIQCSTITHKATRRHSMISPTSIQCITGTPSCKHAPLLPGQYQSPTTLTTGISIENHGYESPEQHQSNTGTRASKDEWLSPTKQQTSSGTDAVRIRQGNGPPQQHQHSRGVNGIPARIYISRSPRKGQSPRSGLHRHASLPCPTRKISPIKKRYKNRVTPIVKRLSPVKAIHFPLHNSTSVIVQSFQQPSSKTFSLNKHTWLSVFPTKNQHHTKGTTIYQNFMEVEPGNSEKCLIPVTNSKHAARITSHNLADTKAKNSKVNSDLDLVTSECLSDQSKFKIWKPVHQVADGSEIVDKDETKILSAQHNCGTTDINRTLTPLRKSAPHILTPPLASLLHHKMKEKSSKSFHSHRQSSDLSPYPCPRQDILSDDKRFNHLPQLLTHQHQQSMVISPSKELQQLKVDLKTDSKKHFFSPKFLRNLIRRRYKDNSSS